MPARARRNSQGLASEVSFIDPAGIFTITGDGYLALTLDADGGLTDTGSELGISLADATLTLSASGLAVDPSAVDHDALLNFVADEHIDHTAVSITTSSPLSGGGDLTATRNISLTLATDPGLEDVSGLRVKLKADGGLTRDSDGLSGTPATISAAGVVSQMAAISDLSQTISSPPTQAEVQAISDKVDEVLAAMRTAGILAV